MNKSKAVKIIYILIILLWMGIIFAFSNTQGEKSNDQSQGLSNKIVETAIGMKSGDKSTDELNKKLFANKAFRVNQIIRKIAHMSEYMILTFILILAFRSKHTWNMKIGKAIIIALVICLLYSITDEFHQTLVPGRTGMAIDCLIDTLGGTIAAIIYLIGYKIKNKTAK